MTCSKTLCENANNGLMRKNPREKSAYFQRAASCTLRCAAQATSCCQKDLRLVSRRGPKAQARNLVQKLIASDWNISARLDPCLLRCPGCHYVRSGARSSGRSKRWNGPAIVGSRDAIHSMILAVYSLFTSKRCCNSPWSARSCM